MLERLQKGDSEAFAGLFHAHKARFYYVSTHDVQYKPRTLLEVHFLQFPKAVDL